MGEGVCRTAVRMVKVGIDTSLVEPSEPIYKIEITGETEAHEKNREPRVGWENHVKKAREKGVL